MGPKVASNIVFNCFTFAPGGMAVLHVNNFFNRIGFGESLATHLERPYVFFPYVSLSSHSSHQRDGKMIFSKNLPPIKFWAFAAGTVFSGMRTGIVILVTSFGVCDLSRLSRDRDRAANVGAAAVAWTAEAALGR